MLPLTIVISFDVNEQVMPGSFPGWIANVVHEFGFDHAKGQQGTFGCLAWAFGAAAPGIILPPQS